MKIKFYLSLPVKFIIGTLLLFYPISVINSAPILYNVDKSVSVSPVAGATGLELETRIFDKIFHVKVGVDISGEVFNFIGDSRIKKVKTKEKNGVRYILSTADNPIHLEMVLLPDAFAFRYISKQGEGDTLRCEKTEVKVLQSPKVWYFERKNDWKLKSYAGTWEHCTMGELPAVSGGNALQGCPLLFEYSDGMMAFVTEVGLEAYSGLRWDCSRPDWLKVNFTEGKKGFRLSRPLQSPWRVIAVKKNLTQLVNQQVVRQLSPRPNDDFYADTSYIVPGKSVWRWFSRNTGNPEQEKQYIDYAYRLGFLYSIIDEGWETWDDCWTRVRSLTDYGKEKGVKLFLWNHSKNICDPSQDYLLMRLFLDRVQKAGVAGVKIDFMNSENKAYIDFDIRLLQECAKRKLLVNLHGCQKPSGEEYTYPNEITREGIRGLELNKLEEGPIPAYHNVLLPFTRFVVGHGDYTPLSFTNPGNTTFAHQLATLVAFNSPLQVIAEDPEVLLSNPIITPALDFIKAVPTVWDETLVLPTTRLGETAVVARRKEKDWYVYALNGTEEQKTISIDVSSFDKEYALKNITVYCDDIHARPVKLSQEGHRPSPLNQAPVLPFKKERRKIESVQTLELAPYGGAVLWLNSNNKFNK